MSLGIGSAVACNRLRTLPVDTLRNRSSPDHFLQDEVQVPDRPWVHGVIVLLVRLSVLTELELTMAFVVQAR